MTGSLAMSMLCALRVVVFPVETACAAPKFSASRRGPDVGAAQQGITVGITAGWRDYLNLVLRVWGARWRGWGKPWEGAVAAGFAGKPAPTGSVAKRRLSPPVGAGLPANRQCSLRPAPGWPPFVRGQGRSYRCDHQPSWALLL
ncbi:MAG TPA: hypothetical protein ENK12_01860 [Gammaproteobacteria bacterium]|nr:hypothetical protein [Gammaproteobacteria bacterium]